MPHTYHIISTAGNFKDVQGESKDDDFYDSVDNDVDRSARKHKGRREHIYNEPDKERKHAFCRFETAADARAAIQPMMEDLQATYGAYVERTTDGLQDDDDVGGV